MSYPKHRRRKYYVNPELQGRIMRRLAAYWCIYHLMLWHAMFLYRYLQYRDSVLGGAKPVPVLDLYFGFAAQNATLIICACMIFPLFLWDAFMVSHRIAGPLVRFQQTLRQLSDGERVRHIQLRKGDMLYDLRDAFNNYLDSLEGEDPSQVPALSTSARAAAADRPARSKADSGDESESQLSSIVHDLRDIGTMVRNVKTEDVAGPALDSYAQESNQS